MKLPKIRMPKIAFKKEYWTWIFLFTLIAVGILIYIYREPIGQIFPKAENASIIDLLDEEEITTSSEEEIAEEEKIELEDEYFTETNIFTETAQSGDGITHLARRAMNQYLNEHGQNASLLSRAHKTYVEDYLQNTIGDYGLQIGEKISFSKTLIEKAIDSALQLTNAQLDNIDSLLLLVE
ncbi:MAG: hypothetical protein PHV47_02110 [Candidatus Pacebacteria bacterium]|nr:hypothetical protein [Candidatus Paceibacterota bacterium]MDD5621518.1 hypothetical protein [Candidatus Paceibacterota bacterium]